MRTRLAGALAVMLSILASQAIADSEFDLTFSHVDLRSEEAITSFNVAITGATIRAVSNIPNGWTLTINNEPRWTATAAGGLNEVASAALRGDTLKTVRLRLVRPSDGAADLNVTGNVRVTADFKSERTMTLTRDDFDLRKIEH